MAKKLTKKRTHKAVKSKKTAKQHNRRFINVKSIRNEGILVYSVAGQPMTAEQGGPFRFLIKDPAACHTDELDDCANVKFVDRIELTDGPGRDTRPTDDQEHEELHRRQDENPAES